MVKYAKSQVTQTHTYEKRVTIWTENLMAQAKKLRRVDKNKETLFIGKG